MLLIPLLADTKQTAIRLFIAAVFLILGAAFAKKGIDGLRNGVILAGKGRTACHFHRDQQPVRFWISIALNLGFVALAIVAVVVLLVSPGSAT
jgi:hypothetical protein